MVTAQDILAVPVSDQMQMIALDYAGRSLQFTYDRMNYGGRLRQRLIHIATGIQVEKCFEALLLELSVQYGTEGQTHWRSHDKAEFTIAGQHIDIKSYHVYPGRNRGFPRWFLDAEGLVPVDQLDKASAPDVYVQAFLTASEYSAQRHCYMALFPRDRNWCNRWRVASPIHVSSSGRQQIQSIMIAGEAGDGAGQNKFSNFDLQESINIGPGPIPLKSVHAFSSLQYALADECPETDISVQIDRDGTHIIHPDDWVDLWLDRPVVYFAAWGNARDYRAGRVLDRQTKTKVYTGGTLTRNYTVPISLLRPVSELLF